MTRGQAARRLLGVSAHARMRMVERIGRDATDEEWLEIVAAIVERRATLVRRMEEHEPRREVYAITIADLKLRAVWDPGDAIIVTVLRTSREPMPKHDRAPSPRKERRIWVRGKRRSVMASQ